MLGEVLTKQALTFGQDDDFLPELPIAILYEQNTYGESAAVEIATLAMQQEFEVVLYDKFSAESPSIAHLRTLANSVLDEDIQLVFIISSNPKTAIELMKAAGELIAKEVMPVVVGISSGFTSQEFLDSPQAESIFILQQKIISSNCPSEITSLESAQNYAAVKLLESATQELTLTNETGNKFPSKEETILIQREKLRDILKSTRLILPCLGKTAFDNTGQNKLLNLEIVRVSSGKISPISDRDFLAIIKEKIGLTISE